MVSSPCRTRMVAVGVGGRLRTSAPACLGKIVCGQQPGSKQHFESRARRRNSCTSFPFKRLARTSCLAGPGSQPGRANRPQARTDCHGPSFNPGPCGCGVRFLVGRSGSLSFAHAANLDVGFRKFDQTGNGPAGQDLRGCRASSPISSIRCFRHQRASGRADRCPARSTSVLTGSRKGPDRRSPLRPRLTARDDVRDSPSSYVPPLVCIPRFPAARSIENLTSSAVSGRGRPCQGVSPD